jgi:hypothetical protein
MALLNIAGGIVLACAGGLFSTEPIINKNTNNQCSICIRPPTFFLRHCPKKDVSTNQFEIILKYELLIKQGFGLELFQSNLEKLERQNQFIPRRLFLRGRAGVSGLSTKAKCEHQSIIHNRTTNNTVGRGCATHYTINH